MVYVFSTSWFDSGFMFGVSLRLLLETFHIFYVKVSRWSSRGSHWKSGHYFNKQLSMTSWMGFSPHFAAFFALRPHGRECSFFSPR